MKDAGKYDYGCLMKDAERLKNQYELTTGSAGRSARGRELLWLMAGRGENTLLMLGTHHGREHITSRYLMDVFEDFLKNAPRELTEKNKFVILPMVNPDGAELSIYGEAAADESIAAMPKLHGNYAAWKANANGVDLNRNYPCLWEKKMVEIDCPASESYNGPSAASEPEVRAVMEFTEKLAPRLAVTMHTKGEEIYWGDCNTPELWAESLSYAECIARHSGYALLPPSRDPAVYAAGYENWFRERLRRPCILIEAGRYDGPQPFDERKYGAEIRKKLEKIPQALMFQMNYT